MRTHNLSKIMLKAWKIYRQNKEKGINFAESLHRAWLSAKAEEINAKRIETAKQVAGVTEETNTYSKWKELGYKVVHGSKALFGCSLIWGSRGDNKEYKEFKQMLDKLVDQEEKHLQVNSEEFNQRHRELMELIERAGRKE